MMVRSEAHSGPNLGKGTMTADRFRINLGKEAVKLALDGQWERAAEINRAILELCPNDSEAANRLAKSLMELADYSAARMVLDDLRLRHPNNNIARKNLDRLQKLESAGVGRPPASHHVAGSPPLFIEDGGKSCTTTLRRAGHASALAYIVAGDTVTLVVRGDAVAVHSADNRRLGTVEPRLARRLRKLLAGGNKYSAAVVNIDEGAMSIVIRETQQHPSLRSVVSFPPLRRDEGELDRHDSDLPAEEASDDAEDANLVVDPSPESEQEETLPTLLTEEVDDDENDSGADVPVLDTDHVDGDPVLQILQLQEEEDWE